MFRCVLGTQQWDISHRKCFIDRLNGRISPWNRDETGFPAASKVSSSTYQSVMSPNSCVWLHAVYPLVPRAHQEHTGDDHAELMDRALS